MKKFNNVNIGDIFKHINEHTNVETTYVMLKRCGVTGSNLIESKVIPYKKLCEYENACVIEESLHDMAVIIKEYEDFMVEVLSDIPPFKFVPVDAVQILRKEKVFKWV